ncbi:MAG: hypothetical protein RL701_7897 [Pseudomonadota bacterium]
MRCGVHELWSCGALGSLLLVLAQTGCPADTKQDNSKDGGDEMFGKELRRELILVSPFKAQLVDNDSKPVPGVRIERTWEWVWGKKSGRDETVTDAEGRFQFARVTARSVSATLLRHEPLVGHRVTTKSPSGAEVLLWSSAKHDYEENGENKGRAIDVVCGIDKLPPGKRINAGTAVDPTTR